MKPFFRFLESGSTTKNITSCVHKGIAEHFGVAFKYSCVLGIGGYRIDKQKGLNQQKQVTC